MFHWTKAAKRQVLSRIRKWGGKVNRTGNSGCYCCAFIPVTKTVAAKLYLDSYDRDKCHRYQSIAARHGLAPKTGGIFRVKVNIIQYPEKTPKPHWAYGYLTEIVKLVNYDEFGDDTWDEKRKVYVNDNRTRIYDEYAAIGLNASDVYARNCGIVNGKMVMVDFSNFYSEKHKVRYTESD